MGKLPQQYVDFSNNYPNVITAYEQLGTAVHTSGPLDNKTRSLLKLALSIGAGLEGAVHAHVRKALDSGCNADEIRQTVLIALPTLGMPRTMLP